jgi:hypothetical protein
MGAWATLGHAALLQRLGATGEAAAAWRAARTALAGAADALGVREADAQLAAHAALSDGKAPGT